MRHLVWVLLLCAAQPAAGAETESAPDGHLLGDLTERVQEASRSAQPFLFRVIRVQADPGTNGTYRIFGTGIAVGADRLLTTAGVVGPATSVQVIGVAGTDTMQARVIGVDRRTDVALLEVQGLDFPPIPLADSPLLFPGDPVVALGHGPRPGPVASFGVVVLAEGPRLGLTETDVLQASAPAFPGLTGGALVNLRGELVGMVSGRMALDPATAVLPVGASLAAGFLQEGVLTTVSPTSAVVALPARLALGIVRELTARGRVERGYLGLQVDLVEASRKREKPISGVVVQRVVPGSPAEAAGLLPGDVILEYAQAKVRSPGSLSFLVAATLPGSQVPVWLLRRGTRTRCVVQIAQAPEPAWNPAQDESVPSAVAEAGIAPAVN